MYDIKIGKELFLLKKDLTPCPVWLSGLGIDPQSKGCWFNSQSRAHAWVAGLVSSQGVYEITNRCFFLTSVFFSLFFSFPSLYE